MSPRQPQFPGYTAAVEFKQDKENYRGHVRINPDLSVEVTGIDNEDARQTVENQVRMLVVHRQRVPFEVFTKIALSNLVQKTGLGR